jgi:hypothetical protein
MWDGEATSHIMAAPVLSVLTVFAQYAAFLSARSASS